jgi:hypothetical protein
MSESAVDRKAALRRLLVRAGLVAVYVALVGIVFVLGKGHTLLIDNKDIVNGSRTAIDGVLVSVDGREALELYAGDRDMVLLKGQRHRVSVEPISGGDKVERVFSLPIDTDMLLLSVPKLVGGQEPYIETFVQRDQPRPADEPVGDNNAFTSPDAVAAPVAP